MTYVVSFSDTLLVVSILDICGRFIVPVGTINSCCEDNPFWDLCVCVCVCVYVVGGGLVGCVQSQELCARASCLPRFILLVSFSDTFVLYCTMLYYKFI